MTKKKKKTTLIEYLSVFQVIFEEFLSCDKCKINSYNIKTTHIGGWRYHLSDRHHTITWSSDDLSAYE